MLGNFTFHNPTKLYFGKEAIKGLNKELPKYGKNVLLVYGGGSIKKNGIYDNIVNILKANGKEIFEDAGVMPNPTVEKLYEGVERARKSKADFILAVGGGSVCDYAKAVSVSVNCNEDPWEKYFIRFEDVDNAALQILLHRLKLFFQSIRRLLNRCHLLRIQHQQLHIKPHPFITAFILLQQLFELFDAGIDHFRVDR